MKSTVVIITLLSVAWAVKVPSAEESKDKREAPVGYPGGGSGGGGGHSLHGFPASFGHGDANAISIGAGYSVGGAKPSFSYGAPESSGGYQLSSESLPASGHATIQLAPLTLHSSQGNYESNDLSQLMSQLSHGLSTGALSLSPYQSGEQGGHSVQEIAVPQYSYGEPKFQQYSAPEHGIQSVPSYAAGTKGLGSYSSTGPVLFAPSDSGANQPGLSYGAPNAAYSFGDASGQTSYSQGNSLAALGISDSGHGHGSFGGSGHNLGGATYTLGDSGHSFGGSGLSLGNSGHSFGGSIKHLGGGYAVPSKTSFKPSTFLGAHGDASHSLAGFSGSHGAPSFAAHSLPGGHGGLSLSSSGHGHSFGSSFGGYAGGSSKLIAPSYLPPKTKGFGGSIDSAAAFSSSGHASPPRTTYGIPSASYSGGPATSSHGASSHSPQYYVSSSKFPSFSESGSSFKGPSGHSSLSSFSSGPKHSFGHSGPSSRYGSPKDIQGSYSENVYNTIKYSEELKPRMQH